MKPQIFIIASAVCLTFWMTASFFYDAGSYTTLDQQQGKTAHTEGEVPFAPLEIDSSNIVNTSHRD